MYMGYRLFLNKSYIIWYNISAVFGIFSVTLHAENIIITFLLRNNEQKSDYFGIRMSDDAIHDYGAGQTI